MTEAATELDDRADQHDWVWMNATILVLPLYRHPGDVTKWAHDTIEPGETITEHHVVALPGRDVRAVQVRTVVQARRDEASGWFSTSAPVSQTYTHSTGTVVAQREEST